MQGDHCFIVKLKKDKIQPGLGVIGHAIFNIVVCHIPEHAISLRTRTAWEERSSVRKNKLSS